MPTITVPAARIRQGDMTLFATSLTVEQLMLPNFYNVERLDPSQSDTPGYQRLLSKYRAKRLARYILKGQDHQDAFLPTSIFLATSELITYDASLNTVSFDSGAVGPFSVVDGQHRLEGLRLASLEDSRVATFEVPVNIATQLPHIYQMCHFMIVNTTQRTVDKGVVQSIQARLTKALDVEDMPTLPQWIQNIVDKGDVDKALQIVQYLNDSEDSPWAGRILMAGEEGDRSKSVRQHAFVTQIQRHVLTPVNPLGAGLGDFDKEKKVFLNYWRALSDVIGAEDSSPFYKTNGVVLFCMFSTAFLLKIQSMGQGYKVSTMAEALEKCFDSVEGDYAAVGHADWWEEGGPAGKFNQGALRGVATALTHALNRVESSAEIEV